MAASPTSSIRARSLRRDYTLEPRTQSDVVNDNFTLYTSQHLSFSQLCIQSNDGLIMHPYAAVPKSSTPIQEIQRTVKAGGQSSVVRVVGSQLVTVLRNDQTVVRRSTFSEIAQKFVTQRSEWIDDENDDAADGEVLAKQREHRTKAEKVLAKLKMEQAALEREEREEIEQKRGKEEESELLKEKVQLELDEDNLSDVSETDQRWKVDQESIPSTTWAWNNIGGRRQDRDSSNCRDEMGALVNKFKSADSKVWKEVIDRYKPGNSSTEDLLLGREPLGSILNRQQRDRQSAILRRQAKRRHQLNEWAEIQNWWMSEVAELRLL